MSITPRPTDPNAAAHERLYRSLRQQVMHGELDPGQSMTLRGLGRSYGVSMTPAREAVRRLKPDGHLETFAADSPAGPPRQYYRLTRRGRQRLTALEQEWNDMAAAVTRCLTEGDAR